MLAEHKRVSYDQRTGTWMSGHIMTDGDEFTCAFHNDGAPEGMPPLDHHDYRREFELYPRVLAHVPGAIKQLDGSTLLIEPIIEDFSLTDVDAATLEAEVLKVVLPVLPRKWTFAYVWFSMVGGEGHAGISVTVGKDAIQNLQPPDAMLALLTRLKKAAYDPRTGTWVSGRLEFKPGGQYRSQYSNSETPEWVPAPTVAEYRHEFEAYPRDPSAIPERIRGLLI
ncbi:hypothetical protein [Nocardia sp. NPDC006630]|uniref:hypothetical protein n=1 Tax=Nocardia sp. NPDC006630 TaxID=3157181 RepID=UPI0033B97E79